MLNSGTLSKPGCKQCSCVSNSASNDRQHACRHVGDGGFISLPMGLVQGFRSIEFVEMDELLLDRDRAIEPVDSWSMLFTTQ